MIKIKQEVTVLRTTELSYHDFVHQHLKQISYDYQDENVLLFYTRSLTNGDFIEYQFDRKFDNPVEVISYFENEEYDKLVDALERSDPSWPELPRCALP